MEWFKATAQIHASTKCQNQTRPIIAVIANTFEEDKVEVITNAIDDFLTKLVILKISEEAIAKHANLKNALI